MEDIENNKHPSQNREGDIELETRQEEGKTIGHRSLLAAVSCSFCCCCFHVVHDCIDGLLSVYSVAYCMVERHANLS